MAVRLKFRQWAAIAVCIYDSTYAMMDKE